MPEFAIKLLTFASTKPRTSAGPSRDSVSDRMSMTSVMSNSHPSEPQVTVPLPSVAVSSVVSLAMSSSIRDCEWASAMTL